MGYQNIVGLEAPTEELVCLVSKIEFDTFQTFFNLTNDKVEFWEDNKSFQDLEKYLTENYTVEITSGGTIANTLFNFSIQNFGDNKRFEVEICGNYNYNNYINSNNPLDSLRQLGIKFNLNSDLKENRKGICIIDKESKEVIKIVLNPNSYDINLESENFNYDYIILTLFRLEFLSEKFFQNILNRCSNVVLLVADYINSSKILDDRIKLLSQHEKISYFFGQYHEFNEMKVIKNNKPDPIFKNTEIIGTNGSNDVFIWDVTKKTYEFHKTIEKDSNLNGSTLGAGDAYCGSYLWLRLNGSSILEAHQYANQKALDVFNYNKSRVDFKVDFNKYYGRVMDGRNGTNPDEQRYFDLIRNNCGIVIISCGQTGVDQIGLKVANNLGLANYSLMPNGFRTERTEGITSGEDNLYNAFIIKYSSQSYRFTTYTTAFMADGTLIFDYAKSEGCQATRDACNLNGRPFLDLADCKIENINSLISNWVIENGIRVINIAGNRERFLTQDQLNDCFKKLSYTLMHLSVFLQNKNKNINYKPIDKVLKFDKNSKIKIAIGNNSEARYLIKGFLKTTFNYVANFDDCNLVWSIENLGLSFYFLKSRDIPIVVKNKFCEIGFCGNDIIIESDLIFSDTFNTGLQSCLMVEVRSKNYNFTKTVGTQYPNYCKKVFSNLDNISIIHLHGSAEAWLKDSWCDTIFDTWRTGKTAYTNDLVLHRQVSSTFLHIFFDEKSSLVDNFINLFIHWLYGESIDA